MRSRRSDRRLYSGELVPALDDGEAGDVLGTALEIAREYIQAVDHRRRIRTDCRSRRISGRRDLPCGLGGAFGLGQRPCSLGQE